MRAAVITLAAGRHDHLRRQRDGLLASTRVPDLYIVVAMGDPDVEAIVAGPGCDVVHLPVDGVLPLAKARNLGAEHALTAGADLLIFLDVDCIPGPGMIERYQQVAGEALLCGTVFYLPPPGSAGYRPDLLAGLGRPHPARPAPDVGQITKDGEHRLFWSLSFAVSGDVWRRIGGFDEEYTGYGGEDTDFGQRAAQAGVPLWWIGGAPAYHQHHTANSPPVEHLDDILRNAGTFHDRWGWWPMSGWLSAFEALGLAHHDRQTDQWVRST